MIRKLYKVGSVIADQNSAHNKFIGEFGFLSIDDSSFVFTTILGRQFGSLDGIDIEETDYGVWVYADNGHSYRFDDAYCSTSLEENESDRIWEFGE